MFLSKILEILSTLDKFRDCDQIFDKFRFSGLKRPNFSSPTVDLDSAISSKFSSNSGIPDKRRVDSAPPPTVKPPYSIIVLHRKNKHFYNGVNLTGLCRKMVDRSCDINYITLFIKCLTVVLD